MTTFVLALQVYGDFSSTLKGLITSAVSHGSEIPSQLDWLDMQAVQQQGPEVVLVVLGNQVSNVHVWQKVGLCQHEDASSGACWNWHRAARKHVLKAHCLCPPLLHRSPCAVLHLQLKTSHLRSKAAQSMLAPLQRLMDKAESSISVPYVMHDVSGAAVCLALMGLARVLF